MTRSLHRTAVYISSGSNRMKKQTPQRQQNSELSKESEYDKKANGSGLPEDVEMEQVGGNKMNGEGGSSSSVDVSRRTSSHHKLDDEIEDIENSRNSSHKPIRQ